MQLDFSADEVTVLVELLESALGSTREAVYQAGEAEYKAALRQREALLTSLLQRLGAPRHSVG
jgi:hypothetical protein